MGNNVLNLKFMKVVMVFSLVITFVFSGFFPNEKAQAVAATTGQEQVTEVVKGKLANELKKEAKGEINNQLLNTISLKDLNLGQSEVYKILENDTYFVQFKVKNSSKLEALSNVTIVFDNDKNVVSIEEMSLEMLSEDEARAILYKNGDLVVDEIGQKPDVSPQFSVSKFSDCMSSSGISWGVAWAIGVFCAIACTAGGPAGCTTCILVETAWGGSIVSKCVAKAFGLLK